MRFERSIHEGYVKKVRADPSRARSLFNGATQAIDTALNIPLSESTSKTILRELYEGLREFSEALGYQRGYKFLSHEAITHFLSEVIDEQSIAHRFDRLRKMRNRINYYAEEVSLESVQEARRDVPALIKALKAYSQ